MPKNSRLEKLENTVNKNQALKYMCVIPHNNAENLKVQPCPISEGGTGGEPFFVADESELYEFEARPDVDLFIFRVVRD